jgi:PAS domain-containing protein
MLLFAGLIWRTAAHVERAEQRWHLTERSRLESALRAESERGRAEAERSARLVAEQAMREKDAALSVLDVVLDSTPVGFTLLDSQLCYARINPAFAGMIGEESAHDVGRELTEARGAARCSACAARAQRARTPRPRAQ